MWAADNGFAEVADTLVASGADVNKENVRTGLLAMFFRLSWFSSGRERLGAVACCCQEWALEHCYAAVEQQCKRQQLQGLVFYEPIFLILTSLQEDGHTAIMLAAEEGHIDIVRQLAESEANLDVARVRHSPAVLAISHASNCSELTAPQR